MVNTKLIFVDGISGSGKSTLAGYISRQLNKNNIKAQWIYEQEREHPFWGFEKNNDESDADYIERFTTEYPKNWINF